MELFKKARICGHLMNQRHIASAQARFLRAKIGIECLPTRLAFPNQEAYGPIMHTNLSSAKIFHNLHLFKIHKFGPIAN
jgi:hypothetical protein